MYFFSVLFGLIQFALISYILIAEVKKKSAAAFLWATLFVMFAFPHLVTAIIEDMAFSTETILKSSVFVVGFCLVYLLFRSRKSVGFVALRANRFFEIGESGIEGTAFEQLCFFLFLIAIIGYIASIVRAEGGMMNTSWSGARSIQHGYVSIAGLAIRFIFMFSGLSLFFFLTGRRIKAGIVLLLFCILVLITRNRVQILPVLLFFISLYLLKIKTIRTGHIITGIVLGIGVIYIVYAIRAFRYLGTISNALSNLSWEYINTMVLKFLGSNNGELGLRQYFYFFIEQKNGFEGFNRGYTYIRMLLVYIPSQFTFGLKPQSFDLYMGKAIGMIAGGTTHPTLFADCFGNLNWFGIALGGVWAGIANGIDSVISRERENLYKILLFYLASYSFVVIGRGSVYNGFEEFAWGFLFLYLLKTYLFKLTRVRLVFGNKTSCSQIADTH